jgi:hypothetical protein
MQLASRLGMRAYCRRQIGHLADCRQEVPNIACGMTEVSVAVKVLVLGGIANLVLSFVLGWVLSVVRVRGPIEPHRWLLIAHTVALQEGVMLLGLGFAMRFARMPIWLAIIGATLLVAASAFQDLSGILNWRQHTKDQFAEKSPGWVSASINAVLNTAGLAIVTFGIVRGMVA